MHLLRYFTYDHLPDHLADISRPFCDLAVELVNNTTLDPAERDVAVRKLLEAKDAAVRAALG